MPYPGRDYGNTSKNAASLGESPFGPNEAVGLQQQLKSSAAASDPYVRAMLQNRLALAQGTDRMNLPNSLVEMAQLYNQRNMQMQGLPPQAQEANPFAAGSRTSSSTLSFTPTTGGPGSTQVAGSAATNRGTAQQFARTASVDAMRQQKRQQQPPAPPTKTGVGVNQFYTR